MHYPDSRWRPRCQGKSRDDVSGRISYNLTENSKWLDGRKCSHFLANYN